MHKGVILLVKTRDKEEILSLVDQFLEPYGNGDVWDWYQIGGRWNNTLAPKDKLDNFKKKCDEILVKTEHGWISQQKVDSKQEQLQKAWEECGLEGLNSYCNHYGLGEEGNTYDIVSLKDCIDTVKEWIKDLEKEKEEVYEKMIQARSDAKEGKYDMSGYYAGLYKDAQYQNFCFKTNVYNISTDEAETIPEDIEEYYAVMLDIHN